MKRIILILIWGLGPMIMVTGQDQQAEKLLSKAVYEEEINGEMDEAIKTYQLIVKQYPDNRKVAAEAYFHMGVCYEKLGKQEAKKAYRQVIQKYADQDDLVTKSRVRLAALEKPVGPVVADGMMVRKVWAGPEVDMMGEPSPDGKYLSYVDWDTGDLAIYEIATGKKRRLTNKGSWDESDEFAQYSRWSPDGKQIVYDWFNENDVIDLYIIGLDDSEPRILYSNEEVVWAQTFDWSPDGKQILAIFERKDDINQIVLVSTADGSVRVLKTLDRWPGNMSFSPDGRYIAYDIPQKESSPGSDIFLLAANGSREIPLIEHPAHDFLLGWAPEGKHILFASDRTGTLDSWVIQVDEGKYVGAPEMVKPNMGQIWPLGFTRKGSFYYSISQDRMDIYIAELDPQTGEILSPPKRAITRFEGSNKTPDYSPDGKYLAYTSRRTVLSSFRRNDVGDVLCVRSLETGKDREIFPEGLKSFGYPRWSTDSRSVFVVSWVAHNDSMGIYRIDAQTGEVARAVTSERGGLYWHECSRDGKTVFLVRTDRKKDLRQIVARDIETGMETEIYRAPSSELFYVFSSPDGNRLSLISISGGGGGGGY